MIPAAFPLLRAGATVTSSTTAGGQGAARSEPAEGPIDLTISEAARACGVNRRTIRRHRDAGDFPGAFRDQQNVWRIPTADLEAAGYPPYLLSRLDEPSEATRLDQLRMEVSLLKERLKATQAIAREREARIEDLRLVLRLLPGMAAAQAAPPARLPAGAKGALPVPAPVVKQPGLAPGRRGVVLEPRGIPGPPATERRPGASVGDREAVPTLTRSGGADEADALVWLPESEIGRRQGSSTSGPARSPHDDAIWMPEAPALQPAPTPPIPEHPSRLERSLQQSLSKQPQRTRFGWLPWRRSRT
jgi:transposase-like protein